MAATNRNAVLIGTLALVAEAAQQTFDHAVLEPFDFDALLSGRESRHLQRFGECRRPALPAQP